MPPPHPLSSCRLDIYGRAEHIHWPAASQTVGAGHSWLNGSTYRLTGASVDCHSQVYDGYDDDDDGWVVEESTADENLDLGDWALR
jgi:hypothetical protein